MAITDFNQVSEPEHIKADATVMAAFLKYAKAQHSDENVLFYFNKGNAEALYKKYLDPKASDAVNVSSDITRLAVALAQLDNWNDPRWAALIKKAKLEIRGLIMSDIWRRFIMTDEARKLLPKKVGDPRKAAKLLGIEDVEKLKKAMSAKDDKQRDRLLEEIAKEEGLKDKAKAMVAMLEKAGLL